MINMCQNASKICLRQYRSQEKKNKLLTQTSGQPVIMPQPVGILIFHAFMINSKILLIYFEQSKCKNQNLENRKKEVDKYQ